MSVGATLLRNEVLKARKRLAFWVTLGLFAFITAMEHGEDWYRAMRDPERSFALPVAWASVFSEGSVLALIFASVILILLVSSEFSWRTARQNVIDGLSKTQWFWGKALLIPLAALLFVFFQVAIGGGFALAGTELGAADASLAGPPVLAAAAGLLLAALTAASLAFAAAMAIRSAGPAMAVWFAWMGFGERLLASGLGRVFEGLRDALGYLPFLATQRLLDFRSYDAAALQRAVERAEEAGRAPPTPPDAATAALVCAGWIALLVGGSLVWFRRRDL